MSALASDRYDVVHVFNSWPPESSLAALVAARRSGAKVVFSPIALDLADWPLFHPFMQKVLESERSDQTLRETLAALRRATPRRRYTGADADVPIEGLPGLFDNLRLCCDLADQVVLLSEYERDFLAAVGARIDHAVIVRNGIDAAAMRGGDPETFRKQFGLERYLLCVGRLEYRKNQALAALGARDSAAPLVFVGAIGDPGYVDHVRRLGGRNVRVLERIEDRALLASAYAGASAFVFPSWTEGAPLAAMEAAAAGTPLVLGEMSSEHEHFGADAQYVHPADVEGIASAVARLLEHPDDAARRAARAARFSVAFSIARHADETWALYERLHSTPSAPAPLVADVSALLHFIRVRQPFSGVPWVERNILRELAALDPNLRTIVFNDVKDRFIEIGIGDLTDFDEQRFNTRHWFSSDDGAGTDRRATIRFADASVPVLPHGTPVVNAPAPAFRSRAIAIGKRAMQRAPRPLRDSAIALVRRVRPGFDPYRMPSDLASTGVDISVVSPARPAEDTDEGRLRFEHSLAKVTVHDVARHRPVASAGARLLTLGQSWLSNGPLLAAMIRVVETRALSLEPYVYDLTYHTGAHQTGWSDNDERFARLLQLLRHSRIVFTESRQVEGELQKLRVSRGLTYRTRRTGLRGRDLLDVEPSRAVPRYAPDTFVLYVSSFNKRKHHDFLIHVWSNLYETWIAPTGRSFRLVLAGEVQDERKFADRDFVSRLARSNIDVHASVADSVLARWMRDCALTAYPSLQEGWGLPAQESLMCGKVCLVSSSLPVAQEIVNPAMVRIAPGDFYGWHEALKSWLENAPMRRAFAERAREYRAPTWREIANVIHACE
jgi:glycosyltransferase involved in cell wall biosynthesis